MNNLIEITNNKEELFGKYCYIDTPWIAGDKTIYRILCSGTKSNSFVDVPISGIPKIETHEDMEDVVYVVLDTLIDEKSEILKVRLKDIKVID